MRCYVRGALCITATVLSIAFSVLPIVGAQELCSIPPVTYASAKTAHPQLAFALTELEKYPIATWYSDRNGDYVATAKKLVSTCPESSRLSVVVYGLPQKDCATGYSSSESTIKTSKDYEEFISTLAEIVGDRKVLYMLEPDAVASLTNDSCGVEAGYKPNLEKAIELLSANDNAEIYLDVGYWTLQWPELTTQVVDMVKTLAEVADIKGIVLNTANHRSNAEMAALCSKFQSAMGSSSPYTCIIDTSRNFVPSDSNEWCNLRTAGIGSPPTSQTGLDNVDYFLWLKPPGDSDGRCDDGAHTTDSLRGPEAGLFFEFGFKILWNQGYFVNILNLPSVSMVAATVAPGVCAKSGGPCGSEADGAKCCAKEGEYCQPWSPTLYQCHPMKAKCGVQQVDIDFEGGDLATYFGVLPDVCCDVCATTKACKAYTFVNLRSDGRSACYLKTGSGVMRAVAGVVSAVIL